MPSTPDRSLGIDLGTSNLKVALVGAGGQQLVDLLDARGRPVRLTGGG
jgi:sugar (pentulose or hexulose) kinase